MMFVYAAPEVTIENQMLVTESIAFLYNYVISNDAF